MYRGIVTAAAHVFPEGVGLAGQHARRGYLMLLDVFMRPALLCCGAIMSMLLIEVIVKVLATILKGWLLLVSDAGDYQFLGYIIATGLAIYIMYSSMRYLYLSAVGKFPTQVLAWCGGDGISPMGIDETASASFFSNKSKELVEGTSAHMQKTMIKHVRERKDYINKKINVQKEAELKQGDDYINKKTQKDKEISSLKRNLYQSRLNK